MVHNDVVCSKKSNCIDSGTKILTVSSNRSASKKNLVKVVGEEEEEESILLVNEVNIDEMLLDEDYINSFEVAQYVDDAQDHSLAYMASVLEAKIMQANRYRKIIKCEQCIAAFIENELIEDSFIRFKSRSINILQPCKSTFEICKFVDVYLKTCEGKMVSYESIALQILRRISFETLFVSTDFESHSDGSVGHRYSFIRVVK